MIWIKADENLPVKYSRSNLFIVWVFFEAGVFTGIPPEGKKMLDDPVKRSVIVGYVDATAIFKEVYWSLK